MTPKHFPLPPEAHLPRRTVLRAAAAACLGGAGAVLSACGGGGDDPGDAAAADTGADGGKRTLGGVDSGGTGRPTYFSAALDMVDPFMSAGVVFDTGASRIVDADGATLALTDLGPGMSCRIDASAVASQNGQPTAHAVSIRVGEQLLGAVAAVDLPTRSFAVLGQRVITSSKTVYGAALVNGLSSLRPGLVLQVWGEADATPGQIVATRVAPAASVDRQVVRGVMTRFDRAGGRAEIGALTLLFTPGDTAVVEAGLVAGQVVRATGQALGGGLFGNLQSLRGDAVRLPANREVEVHGRVTHIDSALRFDVDGVPCDISTASQRQGLRWLALGVRAEVHGRSDAHGVLVADAVQLEAPEPLEIEGRITRVDRATRTFVLRGYTVSWSSATVFEGGGANLLSARRRVSVIGRWTADHTRVLASRIHVEA